MQVSALTASIGSGDVSAAGADVDTSPSSKSPSSFVSPSQRIKEKSRSKTPPRARSPPPPSSMPVRCSVCFSIDCYPSTLCCQCCLFCDLLVAAASCFIAICCFGFVDSVAEHSMLLASGGSSDESDESLNAKLIESQKQVSTQVQSVCVSGRLSVCLSLYI